MDVTDGADPPARGGAGTMATGGVGGGGGPWDRRGGGLTGCGVAFHISAMTGWD